MKKQKGYTLVEMLIVLAIMAILSTFAVVSVGIINKARYNAAISNFKSQLSGLSVITKATAQAPSITPSGDMVSEPLCMRLYQDKGKEVYYLELGYRTSSGFEAKYVRDGVSESVAKQNHDLLVFPRFVGITYTESRTGQENTLASTSDTSDMESVTLIEFNKSDGSVRYGAGEFEFNFKGTPVGTVVLDEYTGKNGIK